jgi:predicted TIM-barrel fold metal-dependent hydrolase
VGATQLEEDERQQLRERVAVVDCDVHPYLREGPRDLCDYMSPSWQQRLGFAGRHHGAGIVGTPAFALPRNTLFYSPISRRGDASRDGTEAPGTDPAFVGEHLLDTHGIDRAILLPNQILGIGAMPDPDTAAVLAAAQNDWLVEHWLRVDDRFRGTITVGPRDPAQAAAEIDRMADVPGMVSVLLPVCDIAMGSRHFDPIYETAERHGLPIQVHPAGNEAVFATGAPMAQQPVYKIEWNTMLSQVHQANLISVLCHGVFERFSRLKLVITEGGFSWIPDIIWRLDAHWRALREEVPWVRRLPSEYLADHVRFCTQPFIEAPRDHVRAMFELVDGERVLMFASDYPHWDFDDPRRALSALTEEQRKPVMGENALDLFGDRLL